MKLKDIYLICKRNYEDILSCKIILQPDYVLKYTDRIDDALNELAIINYLRESVTHFSDIFENTKKVSRFIDFHGNQPVINAFNIARQDLLIRMESIVGVYESLGLNQEETIGIDIKLPNTENFTEFKRNIDDLEFVFTKCPFFASKTENLRFGGFDVGSAWLTFAIAGVAGTSALVAGSALLNNIAAFIDKCIVIKSHRLTIQQQKDEIQKSERDQKEKEEIITSLDRVFKIQVENTVKELEEIAKYEISDGDERGRVIQSFEKLEKLIDKGLQIYSSIDSPQEIKALFAPIEMKYLSIGNQFELIEKKDE